MSLKIKIAKLFGQSDSSNHIGIAFRKDALAYFLQTPEQKSQHNQIPVEQENFLGAVSQLVAKDELAANTHLVLTASQYQIVQVDKPSVPEAELIAALKWQVKDLVTIPPEDIVLDYFAGPVLAGGVEKINVVCAKKSELASFVEKFDEHGFQIKSIITEEFAFANLVEVKEQATLMLCQQANEEVVILIVKDGNIYFHRRLRGFAQLGMKSPEELGFGAIDSLSLEIQRSMDYFERQLKQPPIQEIKLVLPIKTEQYLANRLAENTTASVEVLTLPSPVADNKAYAAAFGAISNNTAQDKKG